MALIQPNYNLEEARKAGIDNDDQMDLPFERGL